MADHLLRRDTTSKSWRVRAVIRFYSICRALRQIALDPDLHLSGRRTNSLGSPTHVGQVQQAAEQPLPPVPSQQPQWCRGRLPLCDPFAGRII